MEGDGGAWRGSVFLISYSYCTPFLQEQVYFHFSFQALSVGAVGISPRRLPSGFELAWPNANQDPYEQQGR